MLFARLTEVLDGQPHCAALNMAVDEVLLRNTDTPLLRIYGWQRPAVSLGYFSKYTEVAAQWPDRDLVRRWTGGGVVLHGGDLTYTLVVPRACMAAVESAGDSYRAVHECIAGLLGEGGAVALADSAGTRVSQACFENPAVHDVMSDGRKIAGAAQRRTRHGLLHQGSIQPAPAGLGERLAGAFAAAVGRRALSEAELAEAREIAAGKYATEAWSRRF